MYNRWVMADTYNAQENLILPHRLREVFLEVPFETSEEALKAKIDALMQDQGRDHLSLDLSTEAVVVRDDLFDQPLSEDAPALSTKGEVIIEDLFKGRSRANRPVRELRPQVEVAPAKTNIVKRLGQRAMNLFRRNTVEDEWAPAPNRKRLAATVGGVALSALALFGAVGLTGSSTSQETPVSNYAPAAAAAEITTSTTFDTTTTAAIELNPISERPDDFIKFASWADQNLGQWMAENPGQDPSAAFEAWVS